MSKSMQKVLIIAGGTGGHIFPGLAVAAQLQQAHIEVCWLGSELGLEQKLVSPQYPLLAIAARRVRGRHGLRLLFAPWHLCYSTWQAWRHIRRWQPNVVLALGGFVCAPGGLAAKLARKSLVVHEQNAIAGYTNRVLARMADQVLTAFPQTFSSTLRPQTVGNPVRAEIAALPAPLQRLQGRSHTTPLRILILGGSQGAKALNQLVLTMLREFPHTQALHIWHQAGPLNFDATQQAYQELSLDSIKVNDFIQDMSSAYEWADLVICRSGALTIAELAAAGVASLLVPFPYAVDDHQWHNGRYLADAGAALMIREQELTAHKLQELIMELNQDRQRLLLMAENARQLANITAVDSIIKALQTAAIK